MSTRLPAYFVRVKGIIYHIGFENYRCRIETPKAEKWINLIRVSEVKLHHDEKSLMDERKTKGMYGEMALLQFPMHVVNQHSTGETWILDIKQ